MKIYTRRGDDGMTDLYGGARIEKSAPIMNLIGDVDELNSYLGVAIASASAQDVAEVVVAIQADLFSLGAQLSSVDAEKQKTKSITSKKIQQLEQWIDTFDDRLPALRTFILPGGSPFAALLFVARAICRRVERNAADATGNTPSVTPEILIYLNRLSDLLFVLARAANFDIGQKETAWIPSDSGSA